MKRIGNVMEQIASMDNIERAIHDALHHRSKDNALAKDAEVFMRSLDANALKIRYRLLSGDIPVPQYRSFTRTEHGKRRKIDWNPSFADNVMQHAVFNVVGRRIVSKFLPDTYSGIEGRGRTYGKKRIVKLLRGLQHLPVYYIQLDVRKYYPSIDNGILKTKVRKVVKDPLVLKFFDTIIDSHLNGLPIGNYISQLLANLYLNDFDHWVVRLPGIVGCFRYCDDIILIALSKEALWNALKKVRAYMDALGLRVKNSAQVKSIDEHGLDFMGLVFHRYSITLRKRIERRLRSATLRFETCKDEKSYRSLASYYGWTTELTDGRRFWKRVVGRPLKQCLEEVA
mgnify:CR=1 FL=1